MGNQGRTGSGAARRFMYRQTMSYAGSDFISFAGAEQDVLHPTPIEAHQEQGSCLNPCGLEIHLFPHAGLLTRRPHPCWPVSVSSRLG
jgi:hypothetical protein